jgi:phospholipase C
MLGASKPVEVRPTVTASPPCGRTCIQGQQSDLQAAGVSWRSLARGLVGFLGAGAVTLDGYV